ncbi:CG11598 [Drosophila busckii]|uniref:CG11598 n=2 Tax=Drosophila busckii TaxID=30019 RepID=A0A0M4ETH1_DROBS|nr:CG11598 [Drosophila busckii]
MFRIPPREPKENAPIVFMQHGMTATSDIYLLNGPNNGLAYMLADVGYDVWLGNARGTRYGRRHTKLSPKMKEFWQFSWHEIGTIDVPESIDHVLKLTGQDAVHYVGHSQGGSTYLVMISMKPEYNQKMKTVSLLAPAVYMKGLKLPKVLTTYLTARGDAEFMPSRTLLKTIEPLLCDVNNKVCSKLYFLTGRDSDATNRTILPLLLATHPGGASTRQPLHYWQLSKSDNFAQFDFGEAENQKRYGQEKPPEYKLSNINKKAWISIFYGKNDERVSKSSIMRLQKQLHRPIMNEMPKGWNHLDFVIANDVKEHVNIPIIQKANGYENRHKGRKNKKKKKEVANNTETES